MSPILHSVLWGAIGGAWACIAWWWAPWSRRRRQRRMRMFRRLLAARTALAHEDYLAALVHMNDAIGIECGEDVLPFDKYMAPDWIEQ